MTEKFYTNCAVIGNTILYRGIENGQRIQERVDFRPKLFLPTTKETKYKTLDGQFCDKIEFSDIKEAREFVKKYSDVGGFKFFGNTRWVYVYLSDRFPNHIDFDHTKIVIANIDIEVASENGFAPVENPYEEITAITIKAHGRFYVFGCGDYINNREDVKYIRSRNEPEMLRKFIEFWEGLAPDVVTGWNVTFYDIPYIVNRLARVLGDKESKRLSPWGYLSTRTSNYKGKMHQVVEIVGVSTLDYIELYRKFATRQESEKLNYIAYVELGEKKISYEEHGSLQELYKNDFQKFIDYNIKDVELVDKLEQKLQLINMSLTLAFDAKVNFGDVFTQVRMWDAIIFDYLKSKNIVVPQVRESSKTEQYAGGYVKDIKPGMYDWVISFDLNSLYPNLIAQFNISPEMLSEVFVPGTFYKKETQDGVKYSVDPLLNKELNLDNIKENNLSIAANGHCFSKDKQGFLPEILMRMYEDRKAYKNKMIEAQKQLEKVKEELHRRGL